MPSPAPLRRQWTVAQPFLLALLTTMSWAGCTSGVPGPPSTPPPSDAASDAGGHDGGITPDTGDAQVVSDVGPLATLVISELCADDDGFQIDEQGQTDDWIELWNPGDSPLPLAGWTIDQGKAGGRRHALPAQSLAPGQRLVVWADSSPEQGARHVDFKLSAKGGHVVLRAPNGGVVDQVDYPALATNESFARFPDGAPGFVACRYATPGRPNGSRCGPPPPGELPVEASFRPLPGRAASAPAWPDHWRSAKPCCGPRASSRWSTWPPRRWRWRISACTSPRTSPVASGPVPPTASPCPGLPVSRPWRRGRGWWCRCGPKTWPPWRPAPVSKAC